MIPDSAYEASELPDAEVEVSSQHDPQPLPEMGVGGEHGSLLHKLISQTDISSLQQQNTALQVSFQHLSSP